jgi:3-hydroxyacyl-CoA dehydrogenase
LFIFSYFGLSFLGNFAYFGHTVKIFDSDLRQLDTACERIHHDEDQLYRDGLIEVPKFLVSFIYRYITFILFFSFIQGQILCLNRLEDAVKDVEFIFECIIEDLELKKALIESKLIS